MSSYWDFNRLSSSLTLRLGLVVFCLSLGACSWIPKGESDLDVGIKERGMASWYGVPFHGRLAANGEVFDMEAMTAAHRTLPLGSMVRVVNLLNGKHVRVRINDRGPYVNGRILDLSHAAAAQLGMVEGGLSVIQLEVIGDHRPEFVVQSEGIGPRNPGRRSGPSGACGVVVDLAGWPAVSLVDSAHPLL